MRIGRAVRAGERAGEESARYIIEEPAHSLTAARLETKMNSNDDGDNNFGSFDFHG